MKRIGHRIHSELRRPTRILIGCLIFASLSLLLNGGLINLYSLHRDQRRLLSQMREVKAQSLELDLQLKKAKDPTYIERQALDRYDLVEENDLVFVFGEE